MELQRTLCWKEATSLGIGAMIGAGIFVLSGVATSKAGPSVMISFILASLLAILLGLCYAELASRYPRAGGSYEFVRETMGPFIGTIVGWAYWGAWLAASSFVSQGFGHYLNALTGAPPKLSAVALLVGLGLLNIIGIGMPLLLQARKYETKKKTIPLAIITSIMVVLFLYLGLLFVSIGVMPWQEFGASDVPVALASQQFLGNFGPIFVSLVIVLALPATCNAFIITISRTAFAMGRNGLLPRKVAYVHPRFKTPIWAITLGVCIQIAFTLISSINIAVTATGFLYLLTFIFTMIAFFISRKRITIKDRKTQFFVPLYPVIPISALLICLGLLIPVGKSGLLTGLLWLLLGMVLYLLRLRTITNTEKDNSIKEQDRQVQM